MTTRTVNPLPRDAMRIMKRLIENLLHYTIWALVLVPCGFAVALMLMRMSEVLR